MAKFLIISGATILLIGVLLHFAPWSLNWFGKLPGDIDIKTGSGRIYIPIVSMLIISIVLSLLFQIFKR
jgi:hypothetical protein